MTSTDSLGLTKITAKLFAPMYAAFDLQVTDALLRRDAFLDRVLEREIPLLHEELRGKQLSSEAHRYISHSLKNLGGRKAPPLKQVCIALRHETAAALRDVVAEHNLVRDAFLNRVVAFLRSSGKFLDAIDLPAKIDSPNRFGAEGIPTGPLELIQDTQRDPLYYLRAACESLHGCGLYLLDFPAQLHGLNCYLADEQVPGTAANERSLLRAKEADDLLIQLADFEWALPPTKPSPRGA